MIVSNGVKTTHKMMSKEFNLKNYSTCTYR